MINWVFRDLMITILVILIGLVLISNQNPPKPTEDNMKPAGNLIVTITWPNGQDDVDLWLMGPNEKKPIGFLNKDGENWNLLRDDLGTAADDVGVNYENAFSRGTPQGEYVVNVFAFNVTTGFPKEVKVEVRLNGRNGVVTKIFEGSVTLDRPKQEVTAVTFKLDANGALVPGSVLKLYHPLVYGTEK
jgi:hypothetical protein